MNKEDQLIQYINNNNTIEKVKNYFQKNSINSLDFNNFNNTLLYLVKNNASPEIIEFIIKNQHDKSNIEPLFYLIDHENFEIATLLLNNDANINGKIFDERTPHNYCNILEYIRDTITEEKFDFIFRHNGKTSLVSSRFICYIIMNSVKRKPFYYEKNGFYMLWYILFYKYAEHNEHQRNLFILNTFLLKYYKNKCPLTNEQISQSIEELEEHVILPFNNNKNQWNIYPLDLAISVNNTKIVELLLKYADEHSIILNINSKRRKGIYPVMNALRNNNYDILRSLFRYATKHNIILNLDDSDIYGNRPFEISLKNNDDYIVEYFLKYAQDNNISINIEDCIFLLNEYNVHMLKILIDYANKNSIILNINEKNKEGKNPLFSACSYHYSNYYIEAMFNYAKEHNIIISINDKDQNGNYPLLNAIINENINMVKYLINYATEQHIPLNLNDIDENGNYPLLIACKNKNHDYEIAKLLVDYAEKNNITLNINKNDKDFISPIIESLK
eukprot:jgi/Orpsp1_1/1189234/evm.model.d7180000070466.1